MKRVMIVCVIALVLFTSCSSTPKINPDGSPYWTTNIPKSTRSTYYAVGSAKQSTNQLSQLRAESAAKDAIGRWASTSVDNSLITFIEEAGEVMKTQQMLEVLQNLSVQTVSIALRGVAIEEKYIAPDGTVFVLASYPVKNLKDAYKLQAQSLERELKLMQASAQALEAEAKLVQADSLLAYLEAYLEGSLGD